jgi:small conductance mechanosensitive channel
MNAVRSQIVEEISGAVDTSGVSTWDPLWALVTIVIGVAAGRFARAGARRFGRRLLLAPNMIDLLATTTMWSTISISFVLALTFVGLDVTPLWLLILLVLVVFVVGGRSLLEAFGAGVLLQARAPFRPGDLVVAGEERGVVREVNSRTVILDSFDGRRIHLPNTQVLADRIVNLSHRDERMSALHLDVVYGTDLDEACRIAVDALSEVEQVIPAPTPVAEVRTFEASSVRIRLRFWHHSDELSEHAAIDAAARAAYSAFYAEGIEFAFPQQTLWWGSRDDAPHSDDPPQDIQPEG